MRLKDIVEAKRSAKTTPSKALVPVDQTAVAAALQAKARAVAAAVAKAVIMMKDSWSQDWAKGLMAALATEKAHHEAQQAEEAEDDEDYTPRPFNATDALPDVLLGFWQSVSVSLNLADDVRHASKQYQRRHPMTELSDQLQLLGDQRDFANAVDRHGLGDADSMQTVLQQMDWLADAVGRYHEIDYTRPLVPAVDEFIGRAIPLILAYARAMGA